jgi:hypothetical protein
MLKSAIFTTISIASLLSLTSIADARPVDKKSIHNPENLPTLHLTAKQSQSNISQSDINGISQAISQYFRDKNNKEMPSSPEDDKPACWFFEVKSLKLVSLADNQAEVLAKVNAQSYEIKRISNNPPRWSYKKNYASIEAKNEHSIQLKKSNGKWKVSISVV